MSRPLRWPPDHVDRWFHVDAPTRSWCGARSPQAILAVVRQFDVESCPRYQPSGTDASRPRDTPGRDDRPRDTWCNIFVWDVTRALGCEIPHWVDEEGEPCEPGAGRELQVNGVVAWLEVTGGAHGWSPATRDQAQHAAVHGCPAVAVWPNANAHGHVAVVLPSVGELLIAQSGARCFSSGTLRDGFGSHVDEVRFWIHG